MNRENILNEICLKNCTGIDCDTPHECSDMCKALLNKLLDKYEKQIRAEVIDEFENEIIKQIYLGYEVKAQIEDIAEELKEHK